MPFGERMKIDFSIFNRSVLRLATINLVTDAPRLITRFYRHAMFNVLRPNNNARFPCSHIHLKQNEPMKLESYGITDVIKKTHPIKNVFDSAATLHLLTIHVDACWREADAAMFGWMIWM